MVQADPTVGVIGFIAFVIWVGLLAGMISFFIKSGKTNDKNEKIKYITLGVVFLVLFIAYNFLCYKFSIFKLLMEVFSTPTNTQYYYF